VFFAVAVMAQEVAEMAEAEESQKQVAKKKSRDSPRRCAAQSKSAAAGTGRPVPFLLVPASDHRSPSPPLLVQYQRRRTACSPSPSLTDEQ
jgi:hypothetical protein